MLPSCFFTRIISALIELYHLDKKDVKYSFLGLKNFFSESLHENKLPMGINEEKYKLNDKPFKSNTCYTIKAN